MSEKMAKIHPRANMLRVLVSREMMLPTYDANRIDDEKKNVRKSFSSLNTTLKTRGTEKRTTNKKTALS